MIYIVNLFIAVFLAFFIFEMYPDIPVNASYSVVFFLLWYTLLWLFSFFYSREHFKKIPMVIGLVLYYLKELFVASFRVAYDVITPAHHMKPGILAFPLEAKTDLEITLLANFITLTPGSLSIDISDDRTILYIHETYIENGDIEKHKKIIKDGFEKKILNITR